ncbi:hypothetical protein [Nocardia asiatica]|uniref:hypothetical protein n=1 Tax=Nocardia asiatica TaxID=209252 RepID=UPI002457280B|nr:hypothetical protein [Nocardia asiatica]
MWLCTTVFAAGMLSVTWRGGEGQAAWALVGFAGVLMQNATFTVIEALSAAPHNVDGTNRVAVVGLIGRLGWVAWIIACSVALLGR